MTVNPQETQQEAVQTEAVRNDKEYNFAQMRKRLEQSEAAKARAEQEAMELKARLASNSDVDSYDEPYIDKKYFDKKTAQNMERVKEEAKREAKAEMQSMLIEEKRNNWLKANPDFTEVMKHAQKFADADPELAETILEMPEGFERQKLVYKNIKALGLHKPKAPEESVQAKIDKNRKSPYYQPSGVGSAPYGNSGDFSQSGQKSAYEHMKALQQKMRLG